MGNGIDDTSQSAARGDSGGPHAVLILLAVATVFLSLLMRQSEDGSRVAWLGFFTAACDLIGAYPYAIGLLLTLVCQLFFAGWFVAVGAKLFRMRRPGGPLGAEP